MVSVFSPSKKKPKSLDVSPTDIRIFLKVKHRDKFRQKFNLRNFFSSEWAIAVDVKKPVGLIGCLTILIKHLHFEISDDSVRQLRHWSHQFPVKMSHTGDWYTGHGTSCSGYQRFNCLLKKAHFSEKYQLKKSLCFIWKISIWKKVIWSGGYEKDG